MSENTSRKTRIDNAIKSYQDTPDNLPHETVDNDEIKSYHTTHVLKQHTNGDIFVVFCDKYGMIVAACGPIQNDEINKYFTGELDVINHDPTLEWITANINRFHFHR